MQAGATGWRALVPSTRAALVVLAVVVAIGAVVSALPLPAPRPAARAESDIGSSSVGQGGAGTAHWPLPAGCADEATHGRRQTAADAGELGRDGRVVAIYPVQSGLLGRPVSGEALPCHELLWRVIRQVYPAAAVGLVDRFVVFEPPDPDDPGITPSPSGPAGTPDLGDVVGYVEPEGAAHAHWTLGISLQGLSPADLADTLLHELGHLISLNTDEVDPVSDPGQGCDTYPTSDGCSRPGSLMDDFTARAWPQAELDDWFAIDDVADDTERGRRLHAFYLAHSADFVDEYAATDPDEDFASTFASWCLDEPLHGDRLAVKARFLAGRAELAGDHDRCALLRS